jgi:hypothetical protein
MAELVQFELPSGWGVFAEVGADEPGVRRAARTEDGLWVKATANLDNALEGVRQGLGKVLVCLVGEVG